VSVGQSGKVHADINAKVVKVDGEVSGDISGNEKVVISKSGNVRGNIVAPRVTLEDGAIFKGSIDMDPGDAASSKVSLAAQTPAKNPADDVAPGFDLKSG
jgi:cytoskeletal protein CcmA (bactofilin family)